MASKKAPPKPPPPEVVARIRKEWPTILVPLMKVAYKACRNKDKVEDLVNDALVAILSGAHEWDMNEDPDLKLFAGSVINSIAANQRRSAQSRREQVSGTDEPVDDAVPSSRNPERLTITKEETELGTRVLAALDRHFKPEDKAQEWLALVQRGVTTVADQAAALGLTIRQTKYLRKRIQDMIDELSKDIA